MSRRQRLYERVLGHVLRNTPSTPALTARQIMHELDNHTEELPSLDDFKEALSHMTCRKCHKPLVWRQFSADGRHSAWCCDILNFTNSPQVQ